MKSGVRVASPALYFIIFCPHAILYIYRIFDAFASPPISPLAPGRLQMQSLFTYSTFLNRYKVNFLEFLTIHAKVFSISYVTLFLSSTTTYVESIKTERATVF